MFANLFRQAAWNHQRLALSALLLCAIACASSSARADDPWRQAKNFRVIVGMPPGGGVDAYARLVQRHIGRFLAQWPPLVVQNMPGAGSLLSVNAVANAMPADGVVLGTFSSSLVVDAISQPQRFHVDFRRFKFIGNLGEDSRVCYVRRETGITTMQALAERSNVNFGATAAGTSGNLDTEILKDLFNINVKQVLGYPGSAEKRFAFERGEIDGDCGGFTSIPHSWITGGKINILARFLPSVIPGLESGVPYAGDLLPSGEKKELYKFLVTPEELGRLFLVSDKTPEPIVAALRHAFDAMAADPQFLADANQIGLLISATTGAEVDRRISDLYAAPPNLLDQARAINQD